MSKKATAAAASSFSSSPLAQKGRSPSTSRRRERARENMQTDNERTVQHILPRCSLSKGVSFFFGVSIPFDFRPSPMLTGRHNPTTTSTCAIQTAWIGASDAISPNPTRDNLTTPGRSTRNVNRSRAMWVPLVLPHATGSQPGNFSSSFFLLLEVSQ